MRPAEMFARLARQFQARIELVREDRRVEASSIIDLLTLGACKEPKWFWKQKATTPKRQWMLWPSL